MTHQMSVSTVQGFRSGPVRQLIMHVLRPIGRLINQIVISTKSRVKHSHLNYSGEKGKRLSTGEVLFLLILNTTVECIGTSIVLLKFSTSNNCALD